MTKNEQRATEIEALRQRILRAERHHQGKTDLLYRMSRLRFAQLRSEIRSERRAAS